jgi:glutathione S-transferase
MITVHHLDDSRSQRILWLLEELGEPYEIELHRRDPVTRAAPAILKTIHPLGKSPVIEDNGRVISESGAIIEHILRRYGHGRLQPTVDDSQYDDYLHWMHYAEGSAMPALVIRLNIGRIGEAAAAALPRWDTEVALQLTYINGALEGRRYLLDDFFSAADIQLSFVGELAMFMIGLSDYPNIEAWLRRFQSRSAYKAALQKGGPYRFATT